MLGVAYAKDSSGRCAKAAGRLIDVVIGNHVLSARVRAIVLAEIVCRAQLRAPKTSCSNRQCTDLVRNGLR